MLSHALSHAVFIAICKRDSNRTYEVEKPLQRPVEKHVNLQALQGAFETVTRDLFRTPSQGVSPRPYLYVRKAIFDVLLFGGNQLSQTALRCESLNRVLGHGVSKAQATAISTECWPQRTWSPTCNQKHSYTQSPNVQRQFACRKTLSTGLFTKGFSKQYRSEANTGSVNQLSIDTSPTSIAYVTKALRGADV